MRHSEHDGVVLSALRHGLGWLQPVFVLRLGGVRPGVDHVHVGAVTLQFAHHVHHLRVAHVGAVLLKRKAQHQHARAIHVDALAGHELDDLARHIQRHVVVQTTPREDHFRVVANFLRLVRQVVRVHADAVATHQARTERQEVPLRTGRQQHLFGVDVEAVEDERQFVDERDVHIALGVFNDLRRFCHFDAAGFVGARSNDGGIHFGNFRGGTAGDLLDAG